MALDIGVANIHWVYATSTWVVLCCEAVTQAVIQQAGMTAGSHRGGVFGCAWRRISSVVQADQLMCRSNEGASRFTTSRLWRV